MPPPLQSEQERRAATRRATQHMRKPLAQYVIIIATLCTMILTPTEPELYHTSILSGQMWVDKLFDGHPDHICCELGLSKRCIPWASSCTMLLQCGKFKVCRPGGTVSNIFVHVGHWTYHPTHWWTLPTLKWHHFKMLPENAGDIFISTILYNICLPFPMPIPPFTDMLRDQKLWPFFQHALRAIDGTHIVCTLPAKECGMYQSQKGFLSQNCLFEYSFDLTFVFGYTGWEGSATDSQVWEAALDVDLTYQMGVIT